MNADNIPWKSAWQDALNAWSRYTVLKDPLLCSAADAKKEGLTGSFAMIRFADHAVVIDAAQIHSRQLTPYLKEIFAHEIGHHVYAPQNPTDMTRLLARMRRMLPGIEQLAPMTANLYTDILINDRLKREKGLSIDSVYRSFEKNAASKLWAFYLRTYEILWSLPKGDLAAGITPSIDADASLAARLVRAYSREWLDGAGRFAALCYPYLLEEAQKEKAASAYRAFADTEHAARGEIPAGMSGIDEDEERGAVDPREEAVHGTIENTAADEAAPQQTGPKEIRKRYREPLEYVEIMKQVDPNVDVRKAIAKYYKERALPYLVAFPRVEGKRHADAFPEGLSAWEVGEPIEEVDWVESTFANPHVIPGTTTLRRLYGTTDDTEKGEMPLDLYIGIDCSGSMDDPAASMSYPVLGGVILALSAFRAKARVKAVLSGEPGKYMETDDFTRSETDVLSVLVSYLGTGYAFGITKLKRTFTAESMARKTHILIITDDDIFAMLSGGYEDKHEKWDIAAKALASAGGGGTMLLHSDPSYNPDGAKRLTDQGWNVVYVREMKDIVSFAAMFAKKHYGSKR